MGSINLRAFPFDQDGESEVYGKVIIQNIEMREADNDHSNIKCKINISFVNKAMVECDVNMVENIGNELYRPYFYEFYAESIPKVFLGKIAPFGDYEGFRLYTRLLDKCYGDRRLIEQLQQYHHDKDLFCYWPFEYYASFMDDLCEWREFSSWKKFKIYDSDFESKQDLIQGNLIFSASPVLIRKVALEIVEDFNLEVKAEIESKLFQAYDTRSKIIHKRDLGKIESKINSILGNSLPQTASVFNVGQGHCTAIKYGDPEETVYFDLGMSKGESDTNFQKAIAEIKKIEPKMVILSHWDLDHILGVAYANDAAFKCLWLTPNYYNCYKETSLSAKRLCAYLVHRGADIYMVDADVVQSYVYHHQNNGWIIDKGELRSSSIQTKTKHRHITPANNGGLILRVMNKKSMLLPGDCDYVRMPNKIFKGNYDYLVVPHHGGPLSDVKLTSVINRNAKAVLSVGKGYKHPDIAHMKQLDQRGYAMMSTTTNNQYGDLKTFENLGKRVQYINGNASHDFDLT